MQSKTQLKFESLAMVCGALLSSLLTGTACSHLNDPFKDSSASIDSEMTTTSAEGYKGKREFYVPVHRRGATTPVCYENGSVTHWPTWFEDPFEDKGNDVTNPDDRDSIDNKFVWNWVDFLHLGYGPGRLLLNTLGYPISAVVTPPGTLMESDGRLDKNIVGYDHDSKRSDSATREPPDGHHLTPDTSIRVTEPSADEPTDEAETIEMQTTTESAPS